MLLEIFGLIVEIEEGDLPFLRMYYFLTGHAFRNEHTDIKLINVL